jgi:cephalosporin-C deacetylase-like acetyl esterase
MTLRTLVVLLLASAPLAAQNPPEDNDKAIHAWLSARTREISGRFLDRAKSREEWEARKPRLRREYLDMLGLWPLPEKTPLNVKVTGTLEHAGAIIEKLHFQSRPGLYVTGNLYRPKESRGRLPAILYVCGHSGRGRDGNKTAFQDHGLWFASNGYVCLIVDTLQLGEVAGKHHGTYNLNRWWWHSAGYTPAGVECWNGIRAIDYLCTRSDVVPERIGVTGISGGGASTVWIAAADERVKVAVPVSGMSDLECYVTDRVINGHCDCMFLVNSYGWEWTTIAALIAPRPMLFANSDNDGIFPMTGNRRIIAKLRELYKLYDKPDLVDDHVSVGGHDYRPDLRLAIFKWINKHLKNDTGPIKDADFKPLPGKELRVFPEDSDLPKDQINDRIDESFVPRAQVKLPEAGKVDEWKAGLMKPLRERVFRVFPERIPAAKVGPGDSHITWETESGIRVLGAKTGEGDYLIVELAPGWDSKPGQVDPKPLPREYRSGVSFLPRGAGETLAWTRKSPPNYVERAHALLGRTVDEGRVWDICAVARYFKEQTGRGVPVVGRGQAGILAAYAALFEPAISEVVIVDPPKSHLEGPYFLGVLRVLDIPDALGLLAPRKLTLIAKDKAFDRVGQIYKIAGAEKQLQRRLAE